MARLSFGIGTSHSPMISQPAEMWPVHAEGDKRNKELCRPPTGEVMAYEDLLAHADPAIGTWISQEKFQAQWEACQRGVDALTKALEEAAPDVAIIVTDDQGELFFDDNYPMFSVYYGDSIALVPREVPAGLLRRRSRRRGDTGTRRWRFRCLRLGATLHRVFAGPGLRRVGAALPQRRVRRQHCPWVSRLPAHGKAAHYGISHGFGFVIKRIMHNMPMPIVPINQNTCYPPNQPMPRRSYALGQALRKAIESWDSDKKVAVIASGGLSHFVVDEEQDRGVLEALEKRDADYLCSRPRERMKLGDVGDAELDHGGRRHGALAVQDG